MADVTKLNVMWDRLSAAHGRDRAAELTAASQHAPSPGDVYVWPPPNDLGLDWVVVSGHADDPAVVYVVPADGHPLAGLADVVVRETGREPLYLRCGRGLWVRHAELPPERRYRVLDPHQLRRAQEKLRQIAVGPLDGSSAAWEDEADPDYEAWMEELTAAVLGLTARGRKPVTLTREDFRPISHFRTARTESPTLAAADDLSAEPAEPGRDDRVAYPVAVPSPGELLLVVEPGGVRAVFRALEVAPLPPVSSADTAGEWHAAEWHRTPKGRGADALLPWVGDQVRLRVGTPEDHQEYTVSRP